MTVVYKICSQSEWLAAAADGVYRGSKVDERDGFIHLSAAGQVRQTAARHFAGQEGLVLVAFDTENLDGVTWEPSRGGDLFPHVYGVLPVAKALWIKDLPVSGPSHRFPDDIDP